MLANVLLLIANAVIGLISLALLARFFMQWQRVSFRNQIGQFVVTVTDWVVKPLRRFVPGLFGLDMASLLPAWVFQTALVFIELLVREVPLSGGVAGVLLGVWGLGLVELLRLIIYLIFAVVLISAVLSWVSPHAPAAPIFNALTAPFLRPFRRVVPTISGIDLSPLVLLLVLQIVLMMLGGVRAGFAPLLVGA